MRSVRNLNKSVRTLKFELVSNDFELVSLKGFHEDLKGFQEVCKDLIRNYLITNVQLFIYVTHTLHAVVFIFRI